MADVPQTYAEWAAHGMIDIMSRSVLNTLIENDPLLGEVPVMMWPGGESYEWILNKTLPTISSINETTTLESTQAKRYKMKTYLSQYGGDIETPVFVQSTGDAALNLYAEDTADLIRAAGRKMSAEIIQGNYMTEANVTIASQWLGTANLGFDAVTAVSANMPTGDGWVKYTHATTILQFRAPGSTTYGTAVDISGGDANYKLTDGDDPTKSVTVTVDVSDLTANKDGVAFTFQRPEEMAGLKELSRLDSDQVFASSGANGDAIALKKLDEIEEAVLGPKGDKIFLCHPSVRRDLKHLIAAAGGMRQGEYQGRDLSKYDLNYEGVPVMASPGVQRNESKGTSSDLSSVYCVRLNSEVGFHLFAGSQNGPNFGTMAAVSDHDVEGGPVTVPGVYLRRLGERENKATYKTRLTIAISGVLKRSQSCAVATGIDSQ
jgi:hypothetical protein